jgi:hypothetical protein
MRDPNPDKLNDLMGKLVGDLGAAIAGAGILARASSSSWQVQTTSLVCRLPSPCRVQDDRRAPRPASDAYGKLSLRLDLQNSGGQPKRHSI